MIECRPMKPALLTLSFLFFAFPLAYGLREQVVDIDGNPVLPGAAYFIVEAPNMNSGVKLGQTGNSTCPVTVQVYDFDGSLVKFSISGGENTGKIVEGKLLDIEFTKTPNCAESSKWMVYFDNDIQNAYVGIGGLKDHPGQEPYLIGRFSIVRNKVGYKFVYSSIFLIKGVPAFCYDIGKYYESDERASRLVFTELNKHKAFEFVLIKAGSYSRIMTVI